MELWNIARLPKTKQTIDLNNHRKKLQKYILQIIVLKN